MSDVNQRNIQTQIYVKDCSKSWHVAILLCVFSNIMIHYCLAVNYVQYAKYSTTLVVDKYNDMCCTIIQVMLKGNVK